MPNRLNPRLTILIALTLMPCLLGPTSASELPTGKNLPVGEIRHQLANAENEKLALNVAPTEAIVTRNLSADTVDLARQLGLLPKLIRLEEERQNASSDNQLIKLATYKQDLVYELMDYEYDIRIASNKIETEVDKANDKYALLAEKRDRAIRLNTYANLVSGGLTGMISGGLNLGRVNPIAPDTIDTVEGVIQTSLSAWGLHELRGEHKLEQGVPNILAALIDQKPEGKKLFPPSVWLYLNSVPSNTLTGQTRQESLITRWSERGFGAVPFKHKAHQQERMSKAAGVQNAPHRITVHVLEDRMAMLTDLQTEIFQMETNLQEILQFIRGTRSLAQNTR